MNSLDKNQKANVDVVKVSYGRRSQVADGHLGRAQVADARHVGHIGLGSNFQPSLIYILKFKFKAQIMNFTVVHWGHVSCSHHVRTLYTHAVSFSITHLLHNAHCTRTLPFAPFPHVLTYFTIQLPSLPFQKWRSQGKKLISSRIILKFLNGRH